MEYAMTITSVAVHNNKESPICGDNVTVVSIEDEGAGPFIVLSQFTEYSNKIRLNIEEIPHINKAIDTLLNQETIQNELKD